MVNATFFDTANTLIDVIDGVNQNTSNGFAVMLLALATITIFIVFINYGLKRVLLLEGFFLTILTTIFYALGWVAFYYIMLPVGMIFAGILLIIFAKEDF